MHSGQAPQSVLDLPVQREPIPNWPCIQGSALKGVPGACTAITWWRPAPGGNTSYTLEDADADPELVEVPESLEVGHEGELHAGVLAVPTPVSLALARPRAFCA